MSGPVAASTADHVYPAQVDADRAPGDVGGAAAGTICPSDHQHGTNGSTICYNKHGCRCADCRAMKAASNAASWARRKDKAPDPRLKPCGTTAAYRRHERKGEPVDDACRAAANADKREREAAAARAALAASNPEPVIEAAPDTITLTLSLADARALAAAALDRALALEPSRYGTGGTTKVTLDAQASIERLRGLNRRLGAAVREVSS